MQLYTVQHFVNVTTIMEAQLLTLGQVHGKYRIQLTCCKFNNIAVRYEITNVLYVLCIYDFVSHCGVLISFFFFFLH